MKNSNYRFSKIKHKLRDLKKRKVKFVVWTLNKETKEYVRDRLKYPVVPFYYSIKTRTCRRVANEKDPLLKELHYSKKRGKEWIVKELKEEQKKMLDKEGIRYKEIKCKIILSGSQ